jgi:two-component system chemotaxis sensor kinase CheA
LTVEAQGSTKADNTHSTSAPEEVSERSPDQEKIAEAPASVVAEKTPPATKKPAPVKKGSGSIRVDIEKIDSLINMVGELVITQSMLSLLGEDFDMSRIERLRDGLDQLERHTREMQESVMRIRMIPISFTFNRFPRLVRDISRQLDKKIELEMIGESTEVDKTVIELIGDPLVHLVRNSLDHGIEKPEDRVAAGKPETGTIILSACHQGGNIVIEIKDDGKGLDAGKLRAKAIEKALISADDNLTESQIYELIFKPGFSTAEAVTDVSGRGVGMDVVRRNIMSLGGTINIESALNQGTTISIHLPLTLAILDGQIAKVGEEVYIVPLASIIETIQLKPNMINLVAGRGEAFKLRDKFMPIIRLHDVFGIDTCESKQLSEGLLVVIEADGKQCGIFVDDLLGQQQVVIKSMETNYKRVQGVSGATILGDGSVALILDMSGIIRRWQTNNATLQVVDSKAAGL